MNHINSSGEAPIRSQSSDIGREIKVEISRQLLSLLDKLPKACCMPFLDEGKAFLQEEVAKSEKLDIQMEIKAHKDQMLGSGNNIKRDVPIHGKNFTLLKISEINKKNVIKKVYLYIKNEADLEFSNLPLETKAKMEKAIDGLGENKYFAVNVDDTNEIIAVEIIDGDKNRQATPSISGQVEVSIGMDEKKKTLFVDEPQEAEEATNFIDRKIERDPSSKKDRCDVLSLFLKEVEETLKCSITCELMVDPVETVDGHTYERRSIEKWFERNITSPMTGSELPNLSLNSNEELKKVIEIVTNTKTQLEPHLATNSNTAHDILCIFRTSIKRLLSGPGETGSHTLNSIKDSLGNLEEKLKQLDSAYLMPSPAPLPPPS